MIYTVTFNPAIDLVVEANLNVGELNRAKTEEYFVGGKGINVSQIVHELGADTLATGFIGGFTGTFIKSELENLGIMHHFVPAEGTTRVNVKVIGQGQNPTELNLTGVNVSPAEFKDLKDYLGKHLKPTDVLVISGNAAEGITGTNYEELCELANEKKSLLVVDTNEEFLEKIIKYKPFLIKPNIHELCGVFKKHLGYNEDIINCGKELQQQGAKNVLVSCGSKGAILIGEDGVYYGDPIEGNVISSVGSGDSMVAGFIVEYLKSHNYKNAFELSLAAGSATCFTTGLANAKSIKKLLKEASVVKQEFNQ